MVDKPIYIIGEIGQNHNGSVDIAKLIVELTARSVYIDPPVDRYSTLNAVKMTRRDLKHELSSNQMNAPYDNPHSFGATYGEHRAALELDDDEHYEVYRHAKRYGLEFVETICAPGAMSVLKKFTPDRLKVASRDITNIPLLEALAETRIPLILSTGMAGERELDAALSVITRHHHNIAILHCVSQYPTDPRQCNLLRISTLRARYPDFEIGLSDHTDGLTAPLVAIALGIRIIEKHITIDRYMKGTDQFGSLGPDGVRRLVRDVRLGELMLGDGDIGIPDASRPALVKLRRSLATTRAIKKGERIAEADLQLLSPGDGFSWAERQSVIGRLARVDIGVDEIVYKDMIEAD